MAKTERFGEVTFFSSQGLVWILESPQKIWSQRNNRLGCNHAWKAAVAIDRGSLTTRISRNSGLKRGYTGSFTLASLVRDVKTVKTFCSVCECALKADIAIAYCMYKNCHFGNAVPCSPVTKIGVS